MLTLDNQNGEYVLPINFKIGKVVTLGEQSLDIFVEPAYTPEGLQSGSAAEWGIKLNVTFLFPDLKLGPLCGSNGGHSCSWR